MDENEKIWALAEQLADAAIQTIGIHFPGVPKWKAKEMLERKKKQLTQAFWDLLYIREGRIYDEYKVYRLPF